MKKLLAVAAASATLGLGTLALADDHMTSTGWEIVERNDDGKVTKVRKDGKTVDVCMNEDQDGCINPRAAGLDWGDVPLDYWPGQPASQKD